MSCWANLLEGFCKGKQIKALEGRGWKEEDGAGITWLSAPRHDGRTRSEGGWACMLMQVSVSPILSFSGDF